MKLPTKLAASGVCLALALLTWLVFAQTLQHDFINFDDPDYVLKNRHVNAGLTTSGIVWAFTTVHAANWHPLTWISHMLDCQLFGLRPWGHHLTSVVLHGTTAILLFLTLRNLTGTIWRSAFVAAVFVVHPLRVESVAWVAERKDVLSGLFFVLTIAAYARYARRKWSLPRYTLPLAMFALGLMCKPMLVTVPLVLLLLDYWPLGRMRSAASVRASLIEKLPFVALAGALGVATVFAQEEALRPTAHYPLSIKLGNAALSTTAYLRQMVWPVDLAAYYPLSIGDVVASRVVPAVALLSLICVAVFLLRRRGYLVVGWLWYVLMLAPVIGIVQVGNQAHADRYTYLPQIGLYLVIAWAAADLLARWPHRRPIAALAAVLVLGPLVFAARTQATHWKDSETLWRQAISRTKNNAMAELNLGEALYKKGAIDESVAHFERAVELRPDVAVIHGSLGSALYAQGRRDEAVRHFRESLELDPRQAGVHSSLGVALLEAGAADESLAHLRKAVEIDPYEPDAHYNLANTLSHTGAAREAVTEYERALQINPNDIQALNNAAWLLATWPEDSARDGRRAVELAEKANALAGGATPVVCATLAAAYAEVGRFPEAVDTASRALRLATEQGDRSRASYIHAQLALYQAGQPSRQQR